MSLLFTHTHHILHLTDMSFIYFIKRNIQTIYYNKVRILFFPFIFHSIHAFRVCSLESKGQQCTAQQLHDMLLTQEQVLYLTLYQSIDLLYTCVYYILYTIKKYKTQSYLIDRESGPREQF